MEGYRKNNWTDTKIIIGGIQREKLVGYRENKWRDTERIIGGVQGE